MILCHKCSGLLASGDSENTTGIYGCHCISGYVRGFEPVLDRSAAIDKQIEHQEGRIKWMTGRGADGDVERIAECKLEILRLQELTK